MGINEENIDQLVSSYKTPFKKSKDEAWNDIVNNIENKSGQTKGKTFTLNRSVISAAASIVVLLAISWFLVNQSYVEVRTANCESIEVQLPDQSTVLLNSYTYITYSKLLWKIQRNVTIKGEAYFKVSPGKKFNVKSELVQIQVLGTEFNVYSRDKVFETKCFSGKVKVNHDKEEVILSKGKAYAIDHSSRKSKQFEFDFINKNDWRTGEFYFEGKTIEFVLKEFARQFDVKLQVPENIKNRIYTGYFSNKDMEEALTTICLPMQLSYTINEDSVIISNEE